MDLVEILERPEGKMLESKRDLSSPDWSQVLALQVHPSPHRPHHLIREGPTARVYVRVGSTNRRAERKPSPTYGSTFGMAP